ncbi:MAG: hypothetical protein IT368_06740, partial [Candidatus Hydrogenedentes bacterium]|nr:hypothetical protein [Candidatus Hydrogenedentota bacterium]
MKTLTCSRWHFALALAVLIGVAAAPGQVTQGVNITVKAGAIGLAPPPVPRDVNANTDPWNDIYKAGGAVPFGSISLMRLDRSLLGLTPHDDIDAFSYPDANVSLPPPVVFEDLPFWPELPAGGWTDVAGTPIFWHFSVDELAIGVVRPLALPPQSAVNFEVFIGTQWNLAPPFPNEAHGDCFFASTAMPGGIGNNYLGADEEQLTLDLPPMLPRNNDDLNGLDLDAALIQHPEKYLQPGEIFFSLDTASPS